METTQDKKIVEVAFTKEQEALKDAISNEASKYSYLYSIPAQKLIKITIELLVHTKNILHTSFFGAKVTPLAVSYKFKINSVMSDQTIKLPA